MNQKGGVVDLGQRRPNPTAQDLVNKATSAVIEQRTRVYNITERDRPSSSRKRLVEDSSGS